MNIKAINYKALLPHVIAVVVFFLLTFTYFLPIFTDNMDLSQHDIKQYQGWGNDLRQYHDETGDYAFWSNNMFGGMPATLSFMPPTNNVFKFFGQTIMLNMSSLHVGMFFITLLGFYILLLCFGCNWLIAILGAIAYAFASYNLIIIDAGHVTKGLAMATVAPIIGGVVLVYRKKYLVGLLCTILFTGLHIYYNHQQISFYLLIILLIIAISYFAYAIAEKKLKNFFVSSALLLAIATFAVLPATDKLLPTLDYSKETMRGGAVLENNDATKEKKGLDIDYAFQWSYGKMETFTLLIPNLYGASSHYNIGEDSYFHKALPNQDYRHTPMYWGAQPFTSGPVYIGAIVCFLFILGLFLVKGPTRIWVIVTVIVSFILAWGNNFMSVNEFFFNNLPLYNKFRTPSMSLIIAGVTMVLLAILALKEMFDREDKTTLLKPLYISSSIVLSICAIFAIFGPSMFTFASHGDISYPDWLKEALVNDRKDMLVADAWRSFGFIFAACAMLFVYIKTNIKANYIIIALTILTLVDLWVVDKRFLNEENFIPKSEAKTIEKTELDKALLKDPDPNYRVLNLATNTYNESITSYYHKSIGGYSPAKLRRYQDIIDYYLPRGRENRNVLNMLNTKYIIIPDQNGRISVQINNDRMGNAWFVQNIQWAENPNKEIEAINNLNIKQAAVIDRQWKEQITLVNTQVEQDSLAVIKLKEYVNPGNLIYTSSNSNNQLAVFSEIYYKNWRAYIDGKEVPVVRVNYILRAIEVPKGEHTIEFKCIDEIYETSSKISIIASIIASLVVVILLGLIIKRYAKNDDNK